MYGTISFATGLRDGLPFTLALAGLLIWISVVDFRHYIIPDLAVLGLLLIGVIMIWRLDSPLADHFIGAVFWSTAFFFVAKVFSIYRGFEGLGLGDVKLVAALGLWLGMPGMIVTVFAAALGGILVLIVGRVLKRAKEPLDETAIAFGPFLCLSAWAVWLQGAAG
ncbi:prepilin peptidase [Jannaschia pohangensis]|nr:A24 family peptidase [Jannaschia pohangensis]